MSHHHEHTPEHHETPDAWHVHTAAEGLPQEEHGGKTNTVILAVAFVLSFGFVAVTILVTYLYFQVHFTSLRAQRIEGTAMGKSFVQYRDRSREKLGGYNFATEAAARAGMASLPLKEAEQQVIARYSAGQQGGSGQ